MGLKDAKFENFNNACSAIQYLQISILMFALGGNGARPSNPYQSRPNYGGGRPSPTRVSNRLLEDIERRIARKPLVGKPIAGNPITRGQSRQRVVGRFVKAH